MSAAGSSATSKVTGDAQVEAAILKLCAQNPEVSTVTSIAMVELVSFSTHARRH